jgi:serine protease Do
MYVIEIARYKKEKQTAFTFSLITGRNAIDMGYFSSYLTNNVKSRKNPMIYCKKVNVLSIFIAMVAACVDIKAIRPSQGSVEKTGINMKGLLPSQFQFLRDGFSKIAHKALQGVVTVLVSSDRLMGPNLDTLSDIEVNWLLVSGVYPKPISQKVRTSGTGFIIKSIGADGKEGFFVVTNYHVVESVMKGSGSVHVRFQSGEAISATVVGVDARTDLAVLSMTTEKRLQALPWGKSEDVKVGNWAIAIGSPGGGGGGHSPSMLLDFSVTHGIVSSVSRVVPELSSTHITHFIQTDAAVNPGNSGGPLLNMDGQVIGINSMGISHSGGSNGMNLAIPSELAIPVINQLARKKPILRGYVGIQIGDNVSETWAEYLGMTGPRGVIIDSVLPNTPAQQGGLKDGDVILSVNGKPVIHHQQARAMIGRVEPGKSLIMRIWRGKKEHPVREEGREVEIKVTVGQLPLDMDSRPYGPQVLNIKEFGISFRQIGAEAMARMRMQLRADSAVLVDTVSNATMTDETVLPGDVLIRINETPVSSLEHVKQVMETLVHSGDRAVKFYVYRYLNNQGYREMTKILAR